MIKYPYELPDHPELFEQFKEALIIYLSKGTSNIKVNIDNLKSSNISKIKIVHLHWMIYFDDSSGYLDLKSYDLNNIFKYVDFIYK